MTAPIVKDPNEEFGKWLRKSHESRGMGVTEFAKHCGVARTTIQSIEKGEANPHRPVSMFVLIARGLDLELAYVLAKAGFDIAESGINVPRLEYIEGIIMLLDAYAPDMRRAMAEAIRELSHGNAIPSEEADVLGRALASLDLVTERIRKGR